ncbi:MAG: entericidin [Rhizobium sp.]
MIARKITLVSVLCLAIVSLSACGNTLRGVGQDTTNVGRSISRAVQ